MDLGLSTIPEVDAAQHEAERRRCDEREHENREADRPAQLAAALSCGLRRRDELGTDRTPQRRSTGPQIEDWKAEGADPRPHSERDCQCEQNAADRAPNG